MPKPDIYLSVIVPAYNEAGRIEKTLRRFNEYFAKQTYTYEILVVNDGSKDGTSEIVDKMIGEIRNMRMIDRKQNKGKLGVFWHTQGSGKSYAMIFLSQKVFRKLIGNFAL